MKEKEFKPLIDREKCEKGAEQHFSKHINLLIDIVNYGSNLIPRALDSIHKKLKDIVVIAILLKQVILMVDAIEVLISKGAVSAAYLQARAAFEASLFIDWILQEEAEKKAKYYYASNLRQQRLWMLRFTAGTPENQIFSEVFKDIQNYINTSDIKDLGKKAKEEIGKIDKFLSKSGWNEISNEFEKTKIKKTGAELEWYKLLRISSIRQLSKQVGRLGEYELFYSRSSEIMHGTASKDHVTFGKGTITFEPIRQLKDTNMVLIFTLSTAIACFMSILKHYRYGELTQFTRKYLQE